MTNGKHNCPTCGKVIAAAKAKAIRTTPAGNVSTVSWTVEDGARLKRARLALGLSRAKFLAQVAADSGETWTESRLAEVEKAFYKDRPTGPSMEFGDAIVATLARLASK